MRRVEKEPSHHAEQANYKHHLGITKKNQDSKGKVSVRKRGKGKKRGLQVFILRGGISDLQQTLSLFANLSISKILLEKKRYMGGKEKAPIS